VTQAVLKHLKILPGLKTKWVILLVLLSSGLIFPVSAVAQNRVDFALNGRVLDSQGLPVQNTHIRLFGNAEKHSAVEVKTNHDGVFCWIFQPRR
jgi:hypothetical protein